MSANITALELSSPKAPYLCAPKSIDPTALPKTTSEARKVFTSIIGTKAPGESIELYQREFRTLEQMQESLEEAKSANHLRKTCFTIAIATFLLLFIAGIIALFASTGIGSIFVFSLVGLTIGASGTLLSSFWKLFLPMLNEDLQIQPQEKRLHIANLMMREELSHFSEYYSKHRTTLEKSLNEEIHRIEDALSKETNIIEPPSLFPLKLAKSELKKITSYQPLFAFDFKKLEDSLNQEIDAATSNVRKENLKKAKELLLNPSSKLTSQQRLQRLVDLL